MAATPTMLLLARALRNGDFTVFGESRLWISEKLGTVLQ